MARQILCAALAAVMTAAIVQPTSSQEPPAGSYQATGHLLLKICRGGNAGQIGYCLGYISGISDGITTLQMLKPPNWTPICKPDWLTDRQLRDVVVKYLVDHPEERHEPISLLTVLAMRSAWPCPP
jgi:hypothetical protein